MYANVIKLYNGYRHMYSAMWKLEEMTLNLGFECGKRKGFWRDSPIKEIRGKPAPIPAEIRALVKPVERTVTNPLDLLFAAIKFKIAATWRQDAFHIVFHSSGYDSRIISAAIKQLLHERGSEWLGEGLLFLSDRWEASEFKQIMQAQGWDKSQYAAFEEFDEDEHFSSPVYDIWQCAPCPIPGNLWFYLPKWAEEAGLIPTENTQVFTGLWANEAWNTFLKNPKMWHRQIVKQYGYHVMASLPVYADWVEYPLVCTEVLDILRRTETTSNGNTLRMDMANHVSPETRHIQRLGLQGHRHPISKRLQMELDEVYRSTYWGKRVPWTVPNDSERSIEWGRWSAAMLIEEFKDDISIS